MQITITLNELKKVATQAIRSYGYSAEEAQIIQDVLLYSEMRGKDQGLVKLIGTGIPRHPESQDIKRLIDTPSMTILDGGRQNAMLAMHEATNAVIDKSLKEGLSMVGLNNTNTSSGCIGYYAECIAKAGLVGFVVASSPTPSVAVHGSKQKMLGTNPLAFAVPSKGLPFVLDISTSAISLYGVKLACETGEQLPKNCAIDVDGNQTTNAKDALNGALLTFGGHKGSGLSLMIELLAGCLTGAGFTGSQVSKSENSGHFLLAINPQSCLVNDDFIQRVNDFTHSIKRAEPSSDELPIFLPGERASLACSESLAQGYVHMDDAVWEKVTQRAQMFER